MSSKFPRIPHLPFSPGGTNDDKRLKSVEHFIGTEIVVTEKIDGGNLCFTREEVYARTHAVKATHKSFDQAKAMHARLRYNIVPDISVFGEYCAYIHDIIYNRLPDYFLVFGIREDGCNIFWPWDMVEHAVKYMEMKTVPVLFKGVVNSEEELEDLTTDLAKQQSCYGDDIREGVVVRLAESFIDFNISVAKIVRADHPRNSDEHWMFKPLKKQGLINE